MKKNDGILILSTGFIAGFIFGFFKAGISGELAGIISKRYFPYGSFRLIFLKFQSPLQKWFLYALLTSILLLVAVAGVFSHEIAETKVAQVMDFAQRHQHPLQCTMEKE